MKYVRKNNTIKVEINNGQMTVRHEARDKVIYSGEIVDYKLLAQGYIAGIGTKKQWTAQINENGTERTEDL